jgi:hypothetical protein
MLSTQLQEWITAGDIDMMQWTQEYGSIGCVDTQSVQLKITGLPCNLNSVPVTEYVLNPFAFLDKHITTTDALHSHLGSSVTTCKCTGWSATESLPRIIRIKVLPQHLQTHASSRQENKCKCPLLFLQINTTTITDEFPIV